MLKQKVIPIIVALCVAIVIAIAIATTGSYNSLDAYTAGNMPAINIRHEAVIVNSDSNIYRMIVSANAPDGFVLFGIVISYDNTVVIPVHHETHDDVALPEEYILQSVTNAPFSLIAYGFAQAPDAWLVKGDRTGFSVDIFTLGQGTNPSEETDAFAFYYRLASDIANYDATLFRIEDGRNADSMVGVAVATSFVRPGIHIQSDTTTYVWGHYMPDHANVEIPDINVQS